MFHRDNEGNVLPYATEIARAAENVYCRFATAWLKDKKVIK